MLTKPDRGLVAGNRNLDVINANLQLAWFVDALGAFGFPRLARHAVWCLKITGIVSKVGFHVLA